MHSVCSSRNKFVGPPGITSTTNSWFDKKRYFEKKKECRIIYNVIVERSMDSYVRSWMNMAGYAFFTWKCWRTVDKNRKSRTCSLWWLHNESVAIQLKKINHIVTVNESFLPCRINIHTMMLILRRHLLKRTLLCRFFWFNSNHFDNSFQCFTLFFKC